MKKFKILFIGISLLAQGKIMQIGRDHLGLKCYHNNMIFFFNYYYYRCIASSMYRLCKLNNQNEIYSRKGNIYKRSNYWGRSILLIDISYVCGLLSSPVWEVWMRLLRSSKAFMLSASKPPANWKQFPTTIISVLFYVFQTLSHYSFISPNSYMKHGVRTGTRNYKELVFIQ